MQVLIVQGSLRLVLSASGFSANVFVIPYIIHVLHDTILFIASYFMKK